ncbi:MAG: peptidoglycan DD-metalloendopeptidase family protein [Gammaproteobacteria bacterium]|nr:peptidoglycan DD-metalloendopeptidase family protein [Gammaproteobacteria bacterium]
MNRAHTQKGNAGVGTVNPFLRKFPVRVACGAVVACVVYLSAQAYLAFPSASKDRSVAPDVPSEPVTTQPEPINLPLLPRVDYDHPPAPRFVSHRIVAGDTLGKLLTSFGTDERDINRIVTCRDECRQLHKLIPGASLITRLTHDSRLISIGQSLPYGQIREYRIYPDSVEVTLSPLARQTIPAFKHVVIRPGESPISAALRKGGIKEATVLRATQILEYDIDFWRNVHPNDEFEIYFDQIFVNDEHVQDGAIHVLRFTNRGRLHEAYLHDDGLHYEADGSAIQKQFLKAPLAYKRISSNFSNARKHPILGYTRAHRGVDYAAPRGTPIRSTADGVVSRVTRNDRAAGNFLAVKHSNGFETRYMHLSGFAPGIRKGTRVSRGSTIGYVGSTGFSTGPHLHYEVIKNGRHLNPLTVPNPSIESLEGPQKSIFLANVENYLKTIEGFREQDLIAEPIAAAQ